MTHGFHCLFDATKEGVPGLGRLGFGKLAPEFRHLGADVGECFVEAVGFEGIVTWDSETLLEALLHLLVHGAFGLSCFAGGGFPEGGAPLTQLLANLTGLSVADFIAPALEDDFGGLGSVVVGFVDVPAGLLHLVTSPGDIQVQSWGIGFFSVCRHWVWCPAGFLMCLRRFSPRADGLECMEAAQGFFLHILHRDFGEIPVVPGGEEGGDFRGVETNDDDPPQLAIGIASPHAFHLRRAGTGVLVVLGINSQQAITS